MISEELLNAVNIERTHDTMSDMILYHKALENEANRQKVSETLEQMNQPFYRFFSNYGTGIGETMEEVVGQCFPEFITKEIPKLGKNGNLLKSTQKNPVYINYNKENGKKPSNYDHLAEIDGVITSWEVKVIRATSGKSSVSGKKIYEIPSLLEERGLSASENKRCSNTSFQQTKAEMFDYLLGVVMYSDQVDFYIVPSSDIKNGKLKITNQHAGAIMEDGSTNEGHLDFQLLSEYKVKSVYNENQLLENDSLKNYI